MSNANPSNNAVVIRQLSSENAADVADYRAIRLAALKDSPDAFGSTYDAEAGLSMEAFAERLATTIVLGAYEAAAGAGDARIIGMVGFKQQTMTKLAHKGFVWGFYVAPAARGRGVGVALVERIVAAATGLVQQLTLSVVQGNDAALALYERCGFETYGVEPRALKSTTGYADEVLMVRFLQG
ncbi:GCN5 family acetyltransferase [Burkholderiaceae bacterium 26]|nr:GCN5 family acetyltransferase [Burkholderiaceae bacterium 26]